MLYKENAIRVKINRSKSGSTYKTFYFKCNDCPKEIASQVNQLKRHSGKCRRCSQLGKPYYFIYNELKNHRNKNVEFTLKYEDLLEIIKKPECHYCETFLIYHEHSRNWGESNTRAHQLDRKNNDKGYILENVVPCCWECNRLKSDRFTYEEFIKFKPILIEIMKNRKKNNVEN